MAIDYRTEPDYIEFLDGRAHPKVSPRDAHAVLQVELAHVLIVCGAREHGRVGSELDAVIGKRDGTKSKLIPDVSFAAFEQYVGLSDEDVDEPPFSPAIAIEVWSPGDSRDYVERKIQRYLATGSQLVLDVHPENRTVTAHTAAGSRVFRHGECFTNDAFPWFTFSLAELFSVVDVRPPNLRDG
jgi:Uma2 family endonuclease